MNRRHLRTLMLAVSSVLALVAALVCWAVTGADSARIPVVLLAGVVAAIVSFAAPLLSRGSGFSLEAPASIGVGSGAWALAIGVGCGWPAIEVIGLVVGCSVLAFLLEYARRGFASQPSGPRR